LNNYVILNPQWLADIMSSLITTKHGLIKKGILNHSDLLQIWKDEKKYPKQIHSLLIQLMEKFEILIPITHLSSESEIYCGKSIVPALLSKDDEPNIIKNWNGEQKIEIFRIYEFKFLPTQVFPRILGCLLPIFGVGNCKYWRDGIVIVEKKSRALVQFYSSNQIMIQICGKELLNIFRKIFNCLQIVLKEWRGKSLEYHISIICPECLELNRKDKMESSCFTFEECMDAFSKTKGDGNGICEFQCQKINSGNVIPLKLVVPELASSRINQIT